MLKIIFNRIHFAIFPRCPLVTEVMSEQLKQAQASLNLLEVQHLDTILHYEHYKYTKMLLEERIRRLQTTDN